MYTFKKFLFEEAKKTRKYVNIQYTKETQDNLRKWAMDQGFDLTANYDGTTQKAESFDFHSTIFYTTSRHAMTGGVTEITPKIAKPIGFKMLGRESDVPVIKLAQDNIIKIRQHYEEMGMKDEWPEYQPHISLSYGKSFPDVKTVDLPTFDLVFDRIFMTDVVDT